MSTNPSGNFVMLGPAIAFSNQSKQVKVKVKLCYISVRIMKTLHIHIKEFNGKFK